MRSVAVLIICLALCACAPGPGNGKQEGIGVRDFRLSDGTRCVTLFQEDIECDWSTGAPQ